MSLYIVNFKRKQSFADVWDRKQSYAVGNTPNEAIEFVKKKFPSSVNDMKDFNAIIVSKYEDMGNYKLYRVKYNDWNMSFSNTRMQEMLAIGRCEEEAICYAKAYVAPDAMDFSAMEIVEVDGHKIIVKP